MEIYVDLKKITIQQVSDAFATAATATESAKTALTNSSGLIGELFAAKMYTMIVKGAEHRINSGDDQKKETVRVRAVLAKVKMTVGDKSEPARLTIVEIGRKAQTGASELVAGEKFTLFQKVAKEKDPEKALDKAIETLEEAKNNKKVKTFIGRMVTAKLILNLCKEDEAFRTDLSNGLSAVVAGPAKKVA